MIAAALAISTSPALAEQIGSRMQMGEAMPAVGLRSDSAPVTEITIAPSPKQLADKAIDASWRNGPAPVMAKILGLKRTPSPNAPLRVGSVFDSGHAAAAPQWQRFGSGALTHFRIRSDSAKGIRARITLPEGVSLGEIRVMAPGAARAEVLPLSVAWQGEIWTPYTEGDTQIVEVYSPQKVEGTPMRVAEIVHFETSLNQAGGGGEPVAASAAGACSPDVACTSGDFLIDAAIDQRRRSVARMNFQSGGGSFLCTGTLINSNSGQNFFMTANHCISTQAEASSLQTRWFYEAANCGGSAANLNPDSVTVGGGATLVFSNQFVDSTLLRLNLNPPAGAIFAGWNATAMGVGQSVVSISHPTGDVKKFALGTINSVQQSTGLIRVSGYEQEMYAVTFTRGVTEQGSSGSGIFTLSALDGLQYRGVLSNSTVRNGSGLSCTNLNETANYGRWDYFQPQVSAILSGQAGPVDDHPNQPTPSATLLPLNGAPVAARIEYVGDLDVFRIVVSESGTLYVKSNGGYDLIGNLMNSAGATLQNADEDNATNDDANRGSTDFGIAWPVTPGTYYLSVANWVPTDLTPNGYSVQASFVNATNNYTALWWSGDAESGWGMNLNHQGNTMFATMFNYENAGLGTQNPGMWLVATLNRVGTTQSYTGQLLRVYGPAFNAVPFPNNAMTAVPVGNMTIDFSSTTAGTLTYTVSGSNTGGNGLPVVKSIVRQTFGTLPTCLFTGNDRSFSSGNFQDLWWNDNEAGWGINFTHQSTTIFATLFTYEPGFGNLNRGLWLTAVMPRESSGVYAGDLNRVTGSAFNAVPFTPLNPATNVTRVGNMRVQFTDGNAGTLTYDVNGSQVVKSIKRQVFGAFPTQCSP